MENFGVTKMGGYMAIIGGTDAVTGDLLQAWVPGQGEELKSAYNEVYDITAFTLNSSHVFLGSLTSFNHTNDTISSAFGPIRPTAFNMTHQGFSGTKGIMSAWGIRCSLNRQSGHLNITRSPNSRPFITSTAFSDEKQHVPSLLASWQVNLNYHAPLSAIAGLGPPLARSALNASNNGSPVDRLSFETFAQNYLYASAEAQRIMHEVAASNASRSRPEFFYDVPATVATLYYRITYVPVVLLLGLLSLLLAALVTAGLMLGATGSLSAKTFRQVDATRLVVDCVAGLGAGKSDAGDSDAFARLAPAPNEEIAKWVEGYRVAYEKVDEDGDVVVRLRRVGDALR
ncbi:uncharacterized protein K452DRAFT_291624 [Aplosporella prunicola CBS 121167]|uniref:Uncharacterized protein n=1 Tax=Aplosporella prunicola CBS 121167 TaxID=1176127 RepID=A0A6A6B0G1_9PEZI|nr:uncharacterized protein K452DRAFT_291624 [Aplosporella prunicola CBS 121167]KAF2137366.1 hypothetical protein K452DRAFT_291624 [Aplosporella prunicola CBS 121167]